MSASPRFIAIFVRRATFNALIDELAGDADAPAAVEAPADGCRAAKDSTPTKTPCMNDLPGADARFMTAALAHRVAGGYGETLRQPNPAVGALIVRDGA